MTSDFTGDGSVAGSPDDESAGAVAAPPRLTEDTGPAAGDGDDGPGLRALAAEYAGDGRGFDLREIAGGWRFYTREDCAPLVERFVRDGQEVRLTQAALETLAVIAGSRSAGPGSRRCAASTATA